MPTLNKKQRSSSTSASTYLAPHVFKAESATRESALPAPAQSTGSQDGIQGDTIFQCEISEESIIPKAQAVELLLPPVRLKVGLPDDFQFNLVDIQTSALTGAEAAGATAFVDRGHNVDASTESVARKRDEAIRASIDSTLDTLLQDRSVAAASQGEASTDGSACEEVVSGQKAALSLSMSELLIFTAQSKSAPMASLSPESPRVSDCLSEPLPEPPIEVNAQAFKDAEDPFFNERPISFEDKAAAVPTRPGRSMFPQSFLAYAQRDIVEYFSHNHRRWLRGSATVCLHRDIPMITYGVCDGVSRQHVENVRLEMLRTPLCDGEAVETSDPRCGDWIPGRIFGRQASSATQLGYLVKLEDGHGIKMVLADRLRRRFEPKDKVEVYTGPVVGWCAATVHALADCLSPPAAAAYSSHHLYCLADPSSRGYASTIEEFSTHLKPEAGSCVDPQLWKFVPLQNEEDLEAHPLWIPSYLLRLANLGDQDCHQETVG